MKKKFSKIVMIAIFAIVAIPLVYALNTIDTGFRSDSGAPEFTIDAHGVCKKVTNTSGKSYFIPTKTPSEWTDFRGNLPLSVSLVDCVGGPINLVISSDTRNYDIYNEAINASWTPGTSVVLTVNPGIYVGSSSTGQPALVTGSFPIGTSVTIINNGYIVGAGGNGGYALGNGMSGGPAFVAQSAVSITNNGMIGGGGGGGGGGKEGYVPSGGYVGGGGGAGYGRNGAKLFNEGGLSGLTQNPFFFSVLDSSGGFKSDWGWDGRRNLHGNGVDNGNGAAGGDGGDIGMPGLDGWGDDGGGLGGPAGAAVTGNSYITWLSGNDSTHIKGAIN